MEQISQQCERVRPHTYTYLISSAVQYYKVLSNCVRLTLFNQPKMDSSKDSILQILRGNKERKIQDQTKVTDKLNRKQPNIFPFFWQGGGGCGMKIGCIELKTFYHL